MKEIHWFYDPQADESTSSASIDYLPEDEAKHAHNVLRLDVGTEIMVTNGKGGLWRACIVPDPNATGGKQNKKRGIQVAYQKQEVLPADTPSVFSSHIAVAPTKATERMEWCMEKATEIGLRSFVPLITERSERKKMSTERLSRIAVSGMKQSHKVWLPKVYEPTNFKTFLTQKDLPRHRFIAHCYAPDELPASISSRVSFLKAVQQIPQNEDILVLIGPEGDFSPKEVEMCVQDYGFTPITLGTARLRTETAALAAIHMMSLRGEF